MKRLEDMPEPELRALMQGLARCVNEPLQTLVDGKPLFVLLVFNDPQVAQYVSSCHRSDMVKALREAADRIERNETIER